MSHCGNALADARAGQLTRDRAERLTSPGNTRRQRRHETHSGDSEE